MHISVSVYYKRTIRNLLFLFPAIQSRFALQNMHGKGGISRFPAMPARVLVCRLCLVVEELPYLQEAIQRIRPRLLELMGTKKKGPCKQGSHLHRQNEQSGVGVVWGEKFEIFSSNRPF
jgi:hypothetical protein